TQILGNSLETIAMEKAGIIKPNVPVVISETQSQTQPIFDRVAHQLGSKIIYADTLEFPVPKTDLLGHYQEKNIKGVWACIQELTAFEISQAHISRGLGNVVRNTGLMGRWQILGKDPLVVCDTAHNKEGLTYVVKQIQGQRFENLHMVLGFVNDKDLGEVLDLLPKEATYYFVKPNIPRGLEVAVLQRLAQDHGIEGKTYGSVNQGLEAAKTNAIPEDMVSVGGSTFVVAEVV